MIQRVKSASVTVDGQLISTIGKGLLVLAAIAKEDTAKEVESMAAKVLKVKLWDDEQGGGKWKKNVQEINGEVLCGKHHHITWLPPSRRILLPVPDITSQSLNLPFWRLQRKETSPASMLLQILPKAKSSTISSSTKYGSCIARTVLRMVCSKP